jgi:hypothetical protein
MSNWRGSSYVGQASRPVRSFDILTSQGSALISQNNRGTTVMPEKARMR